MSDDKPQNDQPAENAENAAPERQWGRVFMGLRESELSDVERAKDTAWTQRDEDAYLARVRAKAENKAREILERAAQDAAAMRGSAHEQGYAEGLAQAEAELEEFRSAMAGSSHAVLAAIEAQLASVLQQWREDLTSVLVMAVEKAVGFQLDAQRREALGAFYLQALQTLESHRSLTIRTNPEDAPVVEDIVGMTQARYPELQSWKVKPDPSVTPGGLVVESESSLADNRVESRMKAVGQALEHLVIPHER